MSGSFRIVHWRAPDRPWAWCSTSIHSRTVTTDPVAVTCEKCVRKGPPLNDTGGMAYDDEQEYTHQGTIGLHDVLAVPLEIANETDGRTLAAQCRKGGRHLRVWARAAVERAERQGRKITKMKSADNMIIAIDGGLGEQVRRDAAARKQSIGEWVGIACRARLASTDDLA